MGSKRSPAELLGMGSNPYYASPNTHQPRYEAELLGVGSNPYYASANIHHEPKPDSTALASQYSNPSQTNNNASKNRSAAGYTLGHNDGASKKTSSSTKRNFNLW